MKIAWSSNAFFRLLFIVLFLGLPLVSVKESPQGYEIAKFVFWELWWMVFILAMILSRGLKWILRSKDEGWGWMFLIILGLTAIQGGEISFLGSVERKQGWIFFAQLWLFYLALSNIWKEVLRYSISGIRISGILLVLIGISEWNTGLRRIDASFGEPNSLGGFLAMTLAWSGNFVVFVPILSSIIMTESRSVILAILAQMFLIISFLRDRVGKSTVLGLMIFLALILYGWKDLRLSVFNNRADLVTVSVRAAAQRPFTGYGVDNTRGLNVLFATENEPGMKDIVADRSSILILDILLWSGGFGVFSFLAWFGLRIKKMKEAGFRDFRMAASLVSFIVFSFFNPIPIAMWVFFYFVMAGISIES